MVVDICQDKDEKIPSKEPKSQNIYLRLSVKLHRFLSRRTNSTFNHAVLKRLFMSPTNWPPLSFSLIIWWMKLPGRQGKTAVVVRVQEVPKPKSACTSCEQPSLSHTLKARGKVLTFDQLAPDSPKGCDTALLSGPRKAPGTPAQPHQTLTQVHSKGWMSEQARGHRASRGCKK